MNSGHQHCLHATKATSTRLWLPKLAFSSVDLKKNIACLARNKSMVGPVGAGAFFSGVMGSRVKI